MRLDWVARSLVLPGPRAVVDRSAMGTTALLHPLQPRRVPRLFSAVSHCPRRSRPQGSAIRGSARYRLPLPAGLAQAGEHMLVVFGTVPWHAPTHVHVE